MDRRLLAHYNRELAHLRETAAEFAREFPKIAGRLALDREAKEVCPDPFVERLLEGFAFLAARVQVKLDAEFPEFTHGLLETIYPHYLCPTPSMAVVQFEPILHDTSLPAGFPIPRGTALRSPLARGQRTACEYRTAHPVTLWPLQIAEVSYHTRELIFEAPTRFPSAFSSRRRRSAGRALRANLSEWDWGYRRQTESDSRSGAILTSKALYSFCRVSRRERAPSRDLPELFRLSVVA